MRGKFFHWVALLVVMIVAACGSSSEDPSFQPDPSHRVLAEFTSVIGGRSVTKVRYARWEPLDSVGIFMYHSGELLSLNTIIDGAYNRCYMTSAGDGYFVPHGGDSIYVSNGVDGVSFVAYHPYRPALEGVVYPIDVMDQSCQDSIDLIYSDNARAIRATRELIPLSFAHQLTKVEVHLVLAPDLAELIRIDPTLTFEGAQITLTQMARQADFLLANGTIEQPRNRGDIRLKMSPEGNYGEAIVIPSSANLVDRELQASFSGGDLACRPLAADQVFMPGKRYIYTIVLSLDPALQEISYTIEDWALGLTPQRDA